eukprot:CAMPEP_0183505452 /NCGR_PEP_ID=MMETSP0371-20130417/6702_1 /TAXON_ID=268820 /ORGANISM="Peridinium aciculiferum, Strain PAER-2" /LENGTH=60 /DNA_ID=CAMNT_0025701149 /DNA_START=14 /DNA_END=193 /DNA_ORIENTATION=+
MNKSVTKGYDPKYIKLQFSRAAITTKSGRRWETMTRKTQAKRRRTISVGRVSHVSGCEPT